jgi:hypothetical protein
LYNSFQTCNLNWRINFLSTFVVFHTISTLILHYCLTLFFILCYYYIMIVMVIVIYLPSCLYIVYRRYFDGLVGVLRFCRHGTEVS